MKCPCATIHKTCNRFLGLWGEPLRDIKQNVRTWQEEVKNCQIVIDTLSQDVLNTSLSHIKPEDVVNGNKESIGNLLEVFKGLLEYILDKIESDVSSEGTLEQVDITDPDLVTPEVIDDILQRELDNGYRNSSQQPVGSNSDLHGTTYSLENTAELIALGKTLESPSLPGPASAKYGAALNDWSNQKRITKSHDVSSKAYTPGNSTRGLIEEAHRLEQNELSNIGYTPGDSTRGLIEEAHRIEQSDPLAYRNDSYDRSKHESPGGFSSVSSAVSLPKPIDTSQTNLKSISGGAFDDIGVRPKRSEPAHIPSSQAADAAPSFAQSQPVFTHHIYHHYDSKAPNNTPEKIITRPGQPRPQHPTKGFSKDDNASILEPPRQPDRLRAKAQSYDNLQSLMTDTVAMSRQAVLSSPLRSSRQSNIDEELSKALRSSLNGVGHPTEKPLGASRESSPSKHRKVSSLRQRSADSSTSGNEVGIIPQENGISDYATRNNNNNIESDRSKVETSPRLSSSAPTRQSNVEPTVTVPSKFAPSVADELAHRRQGEGKLATTFEEYKEKYYGIVEKRDFPNLGSLSDSEVPSPTDERMRPGMYDADKDPAEVSRQLRESLRQQNKKSVRFREFLDSSAPGRMNSFQNKLRAEDKEIHSRLKALKSLYDYDMNDLRMDVHENLRDNMDAARETEREYRKKVLKSPKRNKFPAGKRRGRSVIAERKTPSVAGSRARKRSYSDSPNMRRKYRSPAPIGNEDLLPLLLEEFPYLHLSTETLHDMWRKSSRQLEQLARAEKETRRKKSKAQVQIEEAIRKQEILTDIMRKELSHNNRMKELKERQFQTQQVKTKIREKRVQSARARKYYEEYQIRMRSKMLKKRTKEELIFKELFKEGLQIQKERLRGLRSYAKEQRTRQSQRQQNYIDSMENYYRDQINILAEAMQQQRTDMNIREKAHSKVLPLILYFNDLFS